MLALGRKAAPHQHDLIHQLQRGDWPWGRCAAQREQARSPHKTGCELHWNPPVPLWRASLLALGREAAPYEHHLIHQLQRGDWPWGRCAAQREQARSPHKTGCELHWNHPRRPCGERACSRWGAKRPLISTTSFIRHRAVTGLGAAAQPNASKLARHITLAASFIGIPPPPCGERACSRWGAKRPLISTTAFIRHSAVTGLGAAAQPNASKLARHIKLAAQLHWNHPRRPMWRASLLALGREAAPYQHDLNCSLITIGRSHWPVPCAVSHTSTTSRNSRTRHTLYSPGWWR